MNSEPRGFSAAPLWARIVVLLLGLATGAATLLAIVILIGLLWHAAVAVWP